jgi:hypothetical protein
MINKKSISCCLILLSIFIFTLSVTEKHVEAAQVSGSKKFSHTAYNLNWGTKTFIYRTNYICDFRTGAYSWYTYKAAINQDLLAYKTPNDSIYPSELGNGAVGIRDVNILDTNNNVNNSQGTNQWSSGLIRSRILPGGTMYFLSRHSYIPLEGIPNATYRVQLRTTFALPASWAPFLWTDYTYTPWF